MTDIVEILRQGLDEGNLTPVGEQCREAADEIEALRQQLAECREKYKAHHGFDWSTLEACHESKRELMSLLAESQAREQAALRHLQTTSYHPGKDKLFVLFESLDSTALDEAIKQAKREALLEAMLKVVDELEGLASEAAMWQVQKTIRRMEEELE